MASVSFNGDLNTARQSLIADAAPSSRQQSYQHVFWDQISAVLGQPFDMTRIPLSKLYQMRRDPMISFALHFIKVPLLTAPWYIKCEDAQVAAFVDAALRKIYGDLVLNYMNSLDFGYSAIVKRFEQVPLHGTYENPDDPNQVKQQIWSQGTIDPITWKNFVSLPPEMVRPEWTDGGDFAGIIYDVEDNYILGFPTAPYPENSNARLITLDHALWITNDRPSTFGSIWGFPRTGPAFRYWWSYWYWWALLDRHVEHDADPAIIVRYPGDANDEVLDANGQPVDYRDIAIGIGENARSGSTIAMPSSIIESQFSGRSHPTPLWNIEQIKGASDFKNFTQLFDRLEVLKLRSLMVPEQAFLEGQGGTSSRNVASEMGDAFDRSQAVLMQEFDEHINRFVIPQLVAINFPDRDVEALKTTSGFSSEDIELSKLLVTLIGQTEPLELGVDVRRILERYGVPVLTAEQIKAKQQEAIQMAAAAQPPPTEPVAGKSAGVQTRPKEPNGPGVSNSKTGFDNVYVQPRDKIYLSADKFASSLPDVPPFLDTSIISYTKQMRNLWVQFFEGQYDDFISFVRQMQLEDVPLDQLNLDAKDVPNEPGKTNWVEKLGGLPKKIADMAGDLITERGFMTSHAIATAVSNAKKLAAKHPEWAEAVAHWERMKAQASAGLARIGQMKAEDAEATVNMALAVEILALAEEPDPKKRAEAIINRWKSKTGDALDKTMEIMRNIMKRAASEELKRANLAINFDVEAEKVAQWAKEHAGFLISSIDETTRKELQQFLADEFAQKHSIDEIAAQLSEHFADFPDWKAERVARTEAMLAYNHAIIYAADQSGVKKVQALDARGGNTDPTCIDRDGKIFDLNDALAETISEHPNGTLTWKIVNAKNLSIEYTEDNERLAWYEPETETIKLAQEIKPSQQTQFLLMLVDTINASTR